ncbi:MAG TPA: TraB/GumN family protein [Chthoniobacterales bacterium]|jgi:hypothetical protein
MNFKCSPRGVFTGCILFAAIFVQTQSSCAGTACVWRVTNAPSPCYLVGTMHALSGKDYPLPPPYYQAIKESQQFYFEVAPDYKSDFGERWDAATTYSKGDEIRHHIHPQTWAFLEKRFRRSNYLGHGFNFGEHYVEDIRCLRPWAITFYIWGIHGYSDVYTENGVDNYIAYQARRKGKACGGLETTVQHVEVLAGMADIDSELLLLDTLVRGDQRRDDFNKSREAWKHGDVQTLIVQEKRERDLNPGGEIRLLDYRNLRWIPKIEGAMKSGKATAVVAGCNHFVGTNSVVDLLQRKGYKIEQL